MRKLYSYIYKDLRQHIKLSGKTGATVAAPGGPFKSNVQQNGSLLRSTKENAF